MRIHDIETIAVEIPLRKNFGVPHGTFAATPKRDPIGQTMWANRPTPRDGAIEVGSRPGFGRVLDEAMIAGYRIA